MLKTLQNFVKIGENFKIPLYLELRSFKTPLYLVLSGPQNIKNMVKKPCLRGYGGLTEGWAQSSKIFFPFWQHGQNLKNFLRY